MTVKLAGAALLTAAGWLLGWNHVRALKRRARLLRAICDALGLFRDELSVLRAPLPVIYAKLHERPFFRLLALSNAEGMQTEALWRRAAGTLELAPEERETLSALGAYIGRYDAARQAEEIEDARRRLSRCAAALEQEIAARAKNFPGLGAALAAMAAAMLF
ncbi:MAG: stage III sporulation protein AB [Oscillospiraceae bacterium]|nr:stage III sporulation protein AB [Oscillospiraceae bacterium]